MGSLTKGMTIRDIPQMLRELEAGSKRMEELQRRYDDAERRKQELWAEYRQHEAARPKSRLGRIFREIVGF